MNYFKTFMLMMGLMVFALGVGYYLRGPQGMISAFLFALLMNFVMYFFSDKMVLMQTGARAVTEEEAPDLYRMLRSLTVKAKMPMPRVYVMDDPSPNAFATGRDPSHAAVAVTTGILKTLDPRQLQAVLGHELSHVKNRDILIMTVAATFSGMLMMLTNIFYGFGNRNSENRNPLGMIVVMLLAPIAATLIQLAISRSREYDADRGGAQLTSPRDMIGALEGIHAGIARRPMAEASPSSAHLFIANPFSAKGVSRMFMTHPSLEERVEALQALSGRSSVISD